MALDPRMTGAATLDLLGRLSRGDGDVFRRCGELCGRLGLQEGDLRRPLRDYSRGMKQKLALVSAFQHEPELLILDEPTTGLDPLVRETVFDLMAEARSAGRTVFHSSHVLSEVDRTCDRVAILRAGRLVALERVDELRSRSLRRMVVDFEGQPPVGELEKAGAAMELQDGRRVVLLLAGPPGPVLEVLARHPVRHLAFPEPGLEEAFAHYYGDDAGVAP